MKRLARFAVIALSICLMTMAASRHFVSPVHANERRSDQKTPARRALLIGIGKYDSLKFPTLEYPVNDVARMSELLRSPTYGFQVTEITNDKESTHDKILAAMQRYLVDEPNEGDTVLFYYSGHGSWVTNSLSHETDKRDETIVPSDAVRPVTKREDLKDIRDKEIAVIFDRALAKKIKLTAIFDSCHSGSIARGDEQSKEVDGVEFDIREEPTPEQEVKPEENGALVLSAAEDYQQASGGRYTLNGVNAKYSHFTAELLQSLYDVPADRQSAQELFRTVAARMVSDGRIQTPTISGKDRLDKTLFGQRTTTTAGQTLVHIVTVDEFGVKKIYLNGGLAEGLSDGDELQRINPSTGKPTDPSVKVRVKKAGLSISEFEVETTGTSAAPTVNNDDVFAQVTWATKKEPTLSVWIEPAFFAEKDLKALARSFQASRSQAEFIREPSTREPHSTIFAEAAAGKPQWKMRLENGTVSDLGGELTPAAVRAVSSDPSTKQRLFFDVPPSVEMRNALDASLRSGDGGVTLAADRESAQYELVGRFDAATDKVEYGWALRSELQRATDNAKAAAGNSTLTLPAMTDWTDTAKMEFAAGQLKTLAMKLGKLRAWLRMPSPIKVGGPEFPYHLEIRERKPTRRTLSPADAVYSQGEYELVLKGDPERLKTSNSIMPQFWAYVLDIDGNGKGAQILLSGTSEHNGGLAKFDSTNPPDEIPLTPPNGPPIKFWEPFGTETFVLLVTDRPIDRGLLNFSGVRDLQSSERGDPVSPLDTLLSKIGVNTQTRGEYTSPDTWAVQRLVFTTVDGAVKEP